MLEKVGEDCKYFFFYINICEYLLLKYVLLILIVEKYKLF